MPPDSAGKRRGSTIDRWTGCSVHRMHVRRPAWIDGSVMRNWSGRAFGNRLSRQFGASGKPCRPFKGISWANICLTAHQVAKVPVSRFAGLPMQAHLPSQSPRSGDQNAAVRMQVRLVGTATSRAFEFRIPAVVSAGVSRPIGAGGIEINKFPASASPHHLQALPATTESLSDEGKLPAQAHAGVSVAELADIFVRCVFNFLVTSVDARSAICHAA